MNTTSIEWTDFSANPLKYRDADGKVVWACVHTSPGCQHCYAETLARRYKKGGPFTVPTTAQVTPFLDERELHRMLTYKPASGKRCFVGDMTDIFGEWVPDELLDRLFAVFALRLDVTWQVLTKRSDRMREYFSAQYRWHYLPNVWLGVSAEDQQRADERIPHLLQTPAAVRFVSAEPLLGPIDFDSTSEGDPCRSNYLTGIEGQRLYDGVKVALDWVIVGGESGPKSRPCDVSWVRSIVQQCGSAQVPCFVKQLGAHIRDRNDAGFDATSHTWADGPHAGSPVDPGAWPDHIADEDRVEHNLNGWREQYQGAPVRVRTRNMKGADPSEWPADLRVREFPCP